MTTICDKEHEEMLKACVDAAKRVKEVANKVIWREGYCDSPSISIIFMADILMGSFFEKYNECLPDIKNGYDIGYKCGIPAVLDLLDHTKMGVDEVEKQCAEDALTEGRLQ